MKIEQYVSKTSHTIAAQVVYFRLYRKMTQAQLAAAIGTKQPAIARLEKMPDDKWSWRTLEKIGAALDVRISADIVPKGP